MRKDWMTEKTLFQERRAHDTFKWFEEAILESQG